MNSEDLSELRAAVGFAYRGSRGQDWARVRRDRRTMARAGERVPEPMWNFLVSAGDVAEALNELAGDPGAQCWPESKAAIRLAHSLDLFERYGLPGRWHADVRVQGMGGQPPSQPPASGGEGEEDDDSWIGEGQTMDDVAHTALEKIECDARTALIVAQASRDPCVRDFRGRYLGGHTCPPPQDPDYLAWRDGWPVGQPYCSSAHLLNWHDANWFLGSSALALCTTHELDTHRVPFIGHTAWLSEHGRTYEGGTLFMEHPWGGMPPNRVYRQGERLHVSWPSPHATGGVRAYDRPGPLATDGMHTFSSYIQVGVQRGRSHGEIAQITCVENSPLRALLRAAEFVERVYCARGRLQRPGDIPWWILTGVRFPQQPTIRAECQWLPDTEFGRNILTLKVDKSSVSPERLAAVYAGLRDAPAGRRARKRGSRAMRLAAWVYAQADSNGTLPDWDDLFERWNTEFAGPPDWRYAFPSWMKQDLGRAVASLLNASRPPDPEWGPPWPAG